MTPHDLLEPALLFLRVVSESFWVYVHFLHLKLIYYENHIDCNLSVGLILLQVLVR